ncbi:unnamed protein product [Merluccius merluccius]
MMKTHKFAITPKFHHHVAEEDVKGSTLTPQPLAPNQDQLSYVMSPGAAWTTPAITTHATGANTSYVALPLGNAPLCLVEEASPVVSMNTSQAESRCGWEEEEEEEEEDEEEEEEEQNQSPHRPLPSRDTCCSAYCTLNQTAQGIIPMLVAHQRS